MKKYLIPVLIFLLNITITNGKSHSSGMHKPSDSSFYGKKWYAKIIYRQAGKDQLTLKPDSLTGKRTFIIFDNTKKSAGGNGGCNSFGGKLSVKGSYISISQIFATQMYCEGIQQSEDNFFSALKKVNRFKIKGSKLFLYKNRSLLIVLESD